MKRVLLQRLAVLPILLIGVTLLAFLLMHLMPGDPARTLAGGAQAPEAVVEQIRGDYGLDEPLPVQYVRYVGNAAQGDFGSSLTFQQPISDLFRERFPATLELVLAALLIGVPTGLILGIAGARRRNSWVDHVATLLAITGLSIPLFWLGFMAAWLLSVQLGVLPLGGRLPSFTTLEPITGLNTVDAILRGQWSTLWESLRHLLLPALTLAIIPAALVARFARASFIEVLGQEYVRTARAYGIPEREIIRHHAAKNALLPLVTLFGILVPAMFVAALLAEVVFSWQGFGTLLLDAMSQRDYAVVQGLVLFLGLLFVVANALVDISYSFLDPRTRRA